MNCRWSEKIIPPVVGGVFDPKEGIDFHDRFPGGHVVVSQVARDKGEGAVWLCEANRGGVEEAGEEVAVDGLRSGGGIIGDPAIVPGPVVGPNREVIEIGLVENLGPQNSQE